MQTQPFSEVLIIGSGFGGICAVIELRKRGITDIRVLERRSFLGGTWLQNAYPGAAVDVQSPLYSLSSEPWDWTQMFAERDELEAYTRAILEKHRLHEITELGANVTALEWDEAAAVWNVQTEARGVFCARFVINASGPLSIPVVPPFPGRERFAGRTFHTNDWDHAYDYRGKRVAVVGSGASAAQVIPAIAADVARLHVFQRTPHWVLPRPDHRFSPAERAVLRWRPAGRLLRAAIYLGLETRVVGFKYSKTMLNVLAQRKALRHIEQQVADPELRRKVTPDYTIGCKRIILSSTLYPALSRPNVELHDRNDAVASINERGIVTTGGRQVELDLIVYATGYDATDGVIPYPVTGRNGATLARAWHEFPRAYLGTTAPGFPNLFFVLGPNTGIGHTSAIFIIESQMRYITAAIEEVRRRGARSIEVRSDAEEAYTSMIHTEMKRTVWQSGGCHSWYQSRSGHVIAMYPGFSFTYRRMASRLRPGHHTFTPAAEGR